MGGSKFLGIWRKRAQDYSPDQQQKKSFIKSKLEGNKKPTMPSKKFSVNSQFSASSQNTATNSSSSTGGCRRAASMHQINELYSAISDLIHTSPPPQCQRANSSTHESCSSDDNILVSEQPGVGVRPVNARAARSASTVSAKSCFAAVATTKGKGMLLEYHDSSDNAKNRGIYSKLVSRFRAKKSRERPNDEGVRSRCIVDGKPIQSIDDLLDLMASEEATKKPKGTKFTPRKKSNSFDSFESNSSVISVHEVSSKLRNWHARAASHAAHCEREAQIQADYSLAESIEEEEVSQSRPFFFVTGSDLLNCDQRDDFDASSIDALNSDGNEANQSEANQSEAASAESDQNKDIDNELQLMEAFHRKLSLKQIKSDSELRVSSLELKRMKVPSKHRHSDLDASHANEEKSNESRGLANRFLSAVFARRSVSCEQINGVRGKRIDSDMSSKKVQQWLEDLYKENGPKSSKNCEKSEEIDPVEDLDQVTSTPKKSQHRNTLDFVKIDKWPSPRNRLPSQPLFYIPNIENEDNEAYLRMLIRF